MFGFFKKKEENAEHKKKRDIIEQLVDKSSNGELNIIIDNEKEILLQLQDIRS